MAQRSELRQLHFRSVRCHHTRHGVLREAAAIQIQGEIHYLLATMLHKSLLTTFL